MNSVLARMQAMADAAKGTTANVGNDPRMPLAGNAAGAPAPSVDFGAVLEKAVREVSDAQNTAQAKAQASTSLLRTAIIPWKATFAF